MKIFEKFCNALKSLSRSTWTFLQVASPHHLFFPSIFFGIFPRIINNNLCRVLNNPRQNKFKFIFSTDFQNCLSKRYPKFRIKNNFRDLNRKWVKFCMYKGICIYWNAYQCNIYILHLSMWGERKGEWKGEKGEKNFGIFKRNNFLFL